MFFYSDKRNNIDIFFFMKDYFFNLVVTFTIFLNSTTIYSTHALNEPVGTGKLWELPRQAMHVNGVEQSQDQG